MVNNGWSKFCIHDYQNLTVHISIKLLNQVFLNAIALVKKSYKDSFTLNEARSPETPIYLSYIPDDLKKVEADAHPNAIYYAMGIKQAIGAISLDKLTTKEKQNAKSNRN